jgi:Autographiviridae RNA polymerase
LEPLEEVERFANGQLAPKEQRRVKERLLIEELLIELAEFMLGPDAPAPTPGLRPLIRQMESKSEKLAFVALSSLMDAIAKDWSDDKPRFASWTGKSGKKTKFKKNTSAAMKVRLEMGRVLHHELLAERLLFDDRRTRRRLTPGERRRTLAIKIREYERQHWDEGQFVVAGNWLLDCVLTRFCNAFELDEDGLPQTTPDLDEAVGELYAEFVRRNQRFLPATEVPPADWLGWKKDGDVSRIGATFVRDPHPETTKTIRRAFTRGTIGKHADGVSALQRVPWAINADMLPVVERFGPEVGHKKLLSDKGARKGAKLRLTRDITIARDRIGGKSFYVPKNCDFRGRVYGIPDFNFQREDHIRALFQFEQGMPIGDEGLKWLAIHVANCGDFGGISKRPFRDRIAWAKKHSDEITRTAIAPAATLDWWRDADAPFSFVAGCKELASAWRRDDPSRHVTHLPVSFDGSCSGIQHLAMMMRDEDAGRLVNLTNSDEPQDVYRLITEGVIGRLNADDNARAQWWRDTHIIDRKLIKRPAMTFAYSVTRYGMVEQLVEVYRERREKSAPTDANAWYLAGLIEDVAKEVLPRPAAVMKYIRGLAEREAKKGRPLKWTSPTGFPCRNMYCKSNVRVMHLTTLGKYCRFRVGEGFEDGILKQDAMDAAAPDFVHSLDSSHLVRVANAATAAGITNIATVHDSFGCLAPQAEEFRRIILGEFADMYSQDVLADLRKSARSSLPLPAKGSLDPREVLKSDYAFS